MYVLSDIFSPENYNSAKRELLHIYSSLIISLYGAFFPLLYLSWCYSWISFRDHLWDWYKDAEKFNTDLVVTPGVTSLDVVTGLL